MINPPSFTVDGGESEISLSPVINVDVPHNHINTDFQVVRFVDKDELTPVPPVYKWVNIIGVDDDDAVVVWEKIYTEDSSIKIPDGYLRSNEMYLFRVRVRTSEGTSEWSEVEATTPDFSCLSQTSDNPEDEFENPECWEVTGLQDPHPKGSEINFTLKYIGGTDECPEESLNSTDVSDPNDILHIAYEDENEFSVYLREDEVVRLFQDTFLYRNNLSEDVGDVMASKYIAGTPRSSNVFIYDVDKSPTVFYEINVNPGGKFRFCLDNDFSADGDALERFIDRKISNRDNFISIPVGEPVGSGDEQVTPPYGVNLINLDWDQASLDTQLFDLSRNEIISYQVTAERSGEFRALQLYYRTSNPAERTIWVSQSPGIVDHVARDNPYCTGSGFREVSVGLDTGTGSRNARTRCILEPGQTYFLNVKAASWDNLDESTCVSGTGCDYIRTFQ